MANNTTLNAGSGGDTVRDIDKSGVKTPVVLLDVGGTGTEQIVDATTIGVPMGACQVDNYAPAPGWTTEIDHAVHLRVDPDQQLMTRSTVLTDEGSLRDDFLGANLVTTLTGTVTFTNGSKSVTATSGAFTTEVDQQDYIKLSTDTETAWAQVADISDNNNLTLMTAYSGTGGAGTGQYTDWPTVTANSATAGIGSSPGAASVLGLATGTNAAGSMTLWRDVDYPPLVFRARVKLSATIASQEFSWGLADNNALASMAHMARYVFTGTNGTQITCVTGCSTDSNSQSSTVVTLPGGGNVTDAGYHLFEVDILSNEVEFWIDGSLVLTQQYHIPYPYIPLNVVLNARNTGSTTSTTMSVDWVSLVNADQLHVTGLVPLDVDVTQQGPGLSAITTVAGNVSDSTSLLAANSGRRGFTLFNESAAAMYLALNAACTATAYTVQIGPNGYYEGPFNWKGPVTGKWTVATGNARITEFT